MFFKYSFYVLLLLYFIKTNYCSEIEMKCSVNTTYGQSFGKIMTSSANRTFCAFLGVPYASAPIGNLRFLLSIPPTKWNGSRYFTEEAPHCLQMKPGGSEDCLFLNIFTHNAENSSLLPVMVYIHGGGFHMGVISLHSLGPENFLDKDVVLVTLQYRLGAFGFLSTEDQVVPGNNGLKDQVRALEWIQENIKFFGGDPEKVTLFGNSAGGAAVHLHMQSPKSEKLFIRAISQSGTALSSFAITSKGKARQDTVNLATGLNCSIESSQEILTCLQGKDSKEIFNVFKSQITAEVGFSKLFRPVVEVETDNAFITANPFSTTTHKPWLTGVNTNEGIFKLEKKFLTKILQLIRSDFKNFGPFIMFVDDLYSNLDEVASSTYDFYFKNASTDEQVFKSVEQIVSDSWFVWPSEQAVKKHNGPLFYYLFDHTGEHSFAEKFNCLTDLGVSHMDELLSLFTQLPIFGALNKVDKNVSNMMVDFWVNFASVGNPTPQPVSGFVQTKNATDFVWEQTDSSNPRFVHIQTNKLTMDTSMFKDRMDFWNQMHLIYKEK